MRRSIPHGRRSQARTPQPRWGAVLSAVALLQWIIAGACVLLPPARAQAQVQVVTPCVPTNNNFLLNMTAGTTNDILTSPFQPRMYCTAANVPDGSLISVCLMIPGGGRRRLTYVGGAASFPYELREGSNGGAPVPDGVYFRAGIASTDGPGSVYALTQLGVIVPAPASVSGQFKDVIAGQVYFGPPYPGGCEAGPAVAISPVIPFTLTVTINLAASCYIAAVNDINFNVGTDGAKTLETRASGNVAVRCPAGTAYTLYLDKGLAPDADARVRVLQQASGAGRLYYHLFKPGSDTDLWNDAGSPSLNGVGGVSGTGNGLNQSYTVQGVVKGGQVLPPSGDYSDRVIITMVW